VLFDEFCVEQINWPYYALHDRKHLIFTRYALPVRPGRKSPVIFCTGKENCFSWLLSMFIGMSSRFLCEKVREHRKLSKNSKTSSPDTASPTSRLRIIDAPQYSASSFQQFSLSCEFRHTTSSSPKYPQRMARRKGWPRQSRTCWRWRGLQRTACLQSNELAIRI